MRNMNKKLLKIILGVLGVIAVGVGLFILIRAINTKKTDQPKTALVVYFTEVTAQDEAEFVDMGETEIVAQEIAIQANANVFRIQQIDWYSENHEENMEHAKKEKEENARPEYLEDLVIRFGMKICQWWFIVSSRRPIGAEKIYICLIHMTERLSILVRKSRKRWEEEWRLERMCLACRMTKQGPRQP